MKSVPGFGMCERIHPTPDARAAPWLAPLLMLLAALLCLRPPETYGTSLALAAVLIAAVALWSFRVAPSAPGRGWIVLGALLAPVLFRTADAPGAVVFPLTTFLLAAALGLAIWHLPGRADLGRRFAGVLGILGTVLASYGLYQRWWGLDRLAEAVAADPGLPGQAAILTRIAEGRAFATFSTPAALGGLLAISLAASVGLGADGRGRVRLVWWAAAAVQSAGLFATESASAAGALLGGLLLAGLFWHRTRRRVAIGLAAVAVLLVGVVMIRGGKLVDVSDPQSPWRLRSGNFRAALAMANDHPWIGVGPGGFAERYPTYRRPGDNETRHVHDLALELVAETGWVTGGLLFLLFMALFLRPIVSTRDGGEGWRRGLALGLAVFALHNWIDYTAYLPSLMWTAALVLGLVALPPKPAARRSPVGGFGTPMSVAVTLVLAAVAGLAGLGRDARIEALAAAARGESERAEALAERAVRLAPWDVEAALLLARATLADAEPRSLPEERRRLALARADRAVRLSPLKPAAREARARARMALGDLAGAYAEMDLAARLYPLHPDYEQARYELAKQTRDTAPGLAW